MDKGDLKEARTQTAPRLADEPIGRAWLAPVAIAAVSASLMLIVALVEGLPLRDPDARYVGSPLALIGLIAGVFLVLDLIPRSWRSARQNQTPFPATVVNTFTERWWGKRGLVVLASLLSFYVTYISYRNLKSFLPFVTNENYDKELLESERWIFFGNDPATFLHDLLGTGISAEVLSTVYLAFLTFVPISLAIALIWSNKLRVGVAYVTALSICWILGALSYYALPALGPAFAEPGVFAALPDTGTTRLQEVLLVHRNEVLTDPHATNAVQSVAAFASLHTGVLFAAALVAHRARTHGAIRLALWLMLGLTMIATVYFGWHYIIDDFAGLFIGAVAVFGGERLMSYFGSSSARRRTLIGEPVPGSSRTAL